MTTFIRKIKKPSNYIEHIKENTSFSIDNITVEHRSNNPKRDYLFVNKKQCKHIPTSPSDMIDMCKKLANVVNDTLANTIPLDEKVLVVGFAETATAIANFVADNLCCDTYVLQTTREKVPNSKEIIKFEEEHSHATTQKLLTYAENPINLDEFVYILFVEDEISTGNTILNFIDAFENKHSGFKYGVASICNWQNVSNHNKFIHRNIDVFYLIGGQLNNTDVKMIEDNAKNKIVHSECKKLNRLNDTIGCYPVCKDFAGDELFRTSRLGHERNVDLSKIYEYIDEHILNKGNVGSVRVIGTEEFMYIPIRIGAYLESKGLDVICHSTTRSPIDVLGGKLSNGDLEQAYGAADAIVSKYNITSLYDRDRQTYIYNLEEHTDLVLLVTDKDVCGKNLLNNYYNTLIRCTDSIRVFSL